MAEETASQITSRLFYELGYSPDEITERLLAELRVNRHAQRVLYPWVRDRVQHIVSRMGRSPTDSFRAEDRARQRREGTTITHSQRSRSSIDSRDHYDQRLRFLTARVPCPGAEHGWKFYRDFTAADHQARITLHKVNRDGAADRMSGHTWAIGVLGRHNVATLAAVTPEKILAELPEGGVRA